MEQTKIKQRCFISKDGKVRICNAVDLKGDGQLWRPKSKKWIPIKIENTSEVPDASSEESI